MAGLSAPHLPSYLRSETRRRVHTTHGGVYTMAQCLECAEYWEVSTAHTRLFDQHAAVGKGKGKETDPSPSSAPKGDKRPPKVTAGGSGPARPTCSHCQGRHLSDRCYQQFPHLRPPGYVAPAGGQKAPANMSQTTPAKKAGAPRPTCTHCKVVGHLAATCWKLHPHLRPASLGKTPQPSHTASVTPTAVPIGIEERFARLESMIASLATRASPASSGPSYD